MDVVEVEVEVEGVSFWDDADDSVEEIFDALSSFPRHEANVWVIRVNSEGRV